MLSFFFFFNTLQASQAAQEAEDNARKAKNSVNSLLAVINDLLDQLGKAVLSVPYVFEGFPDVAVLATGMVCWLPCQCCARKCLFAFRNGILVFSARVWGFFFFFFPPWGNFSAHSAAFGPAFLCAEDCC